ncbi:MAG: T9SS type A sorting domain-containing protein [Bacteroidetes bacterium]|nr:T9SS type A sorting domain-containing protein [Bacteroidota bacterium]
MIRLYLPIALLLCVPPQLLFAQLWTPVPEIDRATTINTLHDHEGILFAGGDTTIYRSIDGGERWYRAENLPHSEGAPVISCFVSYGSHVYAGTLRNGVYVSSDSGASWQSFNEGLTGSERQVSGMTIRTDTLYAATDGSGVQRRALAPGTAWQPFNEGLTWSLGTSIVTYGDRLCASIAGFCFIRGSGDASWTWLPWNEAGFQIDTKSLIAHRGFLFAGTNLGLYRWDGDAPTFEKNRIPGVPDRYVSAMTVNDDRLLTCIWITPDYFAMAESADAGTSWTKLEENGGQVHAILAAGGRLWSARTDGLWFRPFRSTSVHLSPAAAEGPILHAPWPQPVQGDASVAVTLPRTGHVSLRLYDILGRCVRAVTDQTTLEAGTHIFRLDAHGLPRGTYVLHLRTGGTMEGRTVRVGGEACLR